MTVAAYRRGVLAADTCFTECAEDGSPSHRFTASKITVCTLAPGLQIAIVTCGGDDSTERYEAAVRRAVGPLIDGDIPAQLRLKFRGAPPQFVKSIVLVRSPAGSAAFTGETVLRQIAADEYAAIGADSPVALGALHFGADPVNAVRAGIFHGAMSGAPIERVCLTFFNVERVP